MNIRPPKFIRKFIDFELNTGDDISSRYEISKEFNKRWNIIEKDTLNNFLIKNHKDYINKRFHRDYLITSDLEKIKKDFRDDLSFLDGYDLYVRELEEKKRLQEQINKELDELYARIIKDFSREPYKDKFSTIGDWIRYTFKEGDYFELSTISGINKIKANNSIYTIGSTNMVRFTELIRKLLSKIQERRKTNYDSYNRNKKEYTTTGNPKLDKINKLQKIINTRKEQLSKMDKNDPSYKSLVNELDAYVSKLNNLKKQYI